jgi:hypothetical protein
MARDRCLGGDASVPFRWLMLHLVSPGSHSTRWDSDRRMSRFYRLHILGHLFSNLCLPNNTIAHDACATVGVLVGGARKLAWRRCRSLGQFFSSDQLNGWMLRLIASRALGARTRTSLSRDISGGGYLQLVLVLPMLLLGSSSGHRVYLRHGGGGEA